MNWESGRYASYWNAFLLIYEYRGKIGNNISEFTHSNWMTKSYY